MGDNETTERSALPMPLGRAASRAREQLFELIESGVFPPGEKLPGERDLAERVGVSRVVLRDALGALEREGRLHSVPWRGWFVTAPRMDERVTLQSFTEMARSRGLVPGAEVVLFEQRTATLDEARRLALAPASEVVELHRVRTLDTVPICHDVSIVPAQHLPGVTRETLQDASLYTVLEDMSDIRVVRSDYSVRAAGATASVAELLHIRAGAPVLVGEETASELTGRPVVLGRVTYRHDAYEFHATLYRTFQ